MSLREENRRRTQESLVSVALSLFQEKGYGAVTVEEIATRAGVGRRTVFRHFETKEDLVLFDHGEYVASFARVLKERPAHQAPFVALERAAAAVAAELEENRAQLLERLQLVEREPALRARYAELDQRWHLVIVALLAPGRVSAERELQIRLVSGAVVGALNAALGVWVRRGGAIDLRKAVKTLFQLLGDGIKRSGPARARAKPSRPKARSG